MKNFKFVKDVRFAALGAMVVLAASALTAAVSVEDEAPKYKGSSCHFERMTMRAMDDYLAAETPSDMQKAMQLVATYQNLQKSARAHELDRGLHLNCIEDMDELVQGQMRVDASTH